jgi:hypothetical protein
VGIERREDKEVGEREERGKRRERERRGERIWWGDHN